MRAIILTLSIFASLVGCSKSGGGEPSCEQMASKVVEILQSEMGKLDATKRSALEAQLATIRSEFISDCKKDPESFEARASCVMKATSSAELGKCEDKPASAK